MNLAGVCWKVDAAPAPHHLSGSVSPVIWPGPPLCSLSSAQIPGRNQLIGPVWSDVLPRHQSAVLGRRGYRAGGGPEAAPGRRTPAPAEALWERQKNRQQWFGAFCVNPQGRFHVSKCSGQAFRTPPAAGACDRWAHKVLAHSECERFVNIKNQGISSRNLDRWLLLESKKKALETLGMVMHLLEPGGDGPLFWGMRFPGLQGPLPVVSPTLRPSVSYHGSSCLVLPLPSPPWSPAHWGLSYPGTLPRNGNCTKKKKNYTALQNFAICI